MGREAERMAAEGRYKAPTKASWAEFRERFEAEESESLSEKRKRGGEIGCYP